MVLSPGLTILLSLTVFVQVLFLYILSGMEEISLIIIHVLAFSLDLSTPVASCTMSTPGAPSVRWHLATSDDICRYQQAVQCSLVSLSSLLPNDVVLCCEPSCTAHQDLLELRGLDQALKAAAESSIPRSSKRRHTGVAG